MTDILVNPTADNARRWILALSRLPDRAAAELAAEDDVFADDKRYAIRINDEFTVDVMPSIAGFSWAEMAPHIVSMTIDGTSILVLDLPGLLKKKQGARQGSDGRRRHCRGAASARQTLARTRKAETPSKPAFGGEMKPAKKRDRRIVAEHAAANHVLTTRIPHEPAEPAAKSSLRRHL